MERYSSSAASGSMLQRVHRPGGLAVGREAGRQPAFLVGQRLDVEDPGDALAALDLAEQDVLAVRGQRERERGGDRGLAGAALAGHHVQPHARPVGAHALNSMSRARGSGWRTTVRPWETVGLSSVGIARSRAWRRSSTSGDAGGLVLTGEAGLGKSALWELARLAGGRARGAASLRPTPGEGEERYSFARAGATCSATWTWRGSRCTGPVREALETVLLREHRQPVRSTPSVVVRRVARPADATWPRTVRWSCSSTTCSGRTPASMEALTFAARRLGQAPRAVRAHPTRRVRAHAGSRPPCRAATCGTSSRERSPARRRRGC